MLLLLLVIETQSFKVDFLDPAVPELFLSVLDVYFMGFSLQLLVCFCNIRKHFVLFNLLDDFTLGLCILGLTQAVCVLGQEVDRH